MPYILRDDSGQISRVSTRPIPTAQTVSPVDPELLAFLKAHGQDIDALKETYEELRRTDTDMARAIEDVIMALLRKNLIRMTDLPPQVQDKMGQRVKLRVRIQEIYDQASDSLN